MMVTSVLRSGTSLMWAMTLFFIIIYIFSIFLMQQVSHYLFTEGDAAIGAETLTRMWGSLFASSYTLFQAMTGGISWGEISDPLLEIHWMTAAVVAFFVF